MVRAVLWFVLRPPPLTDKLSRPYCKEELEKVPYSLIQHITDNHQGGIAAATSNGDEETIRQLLSNYPHTVDERDQGQHAPLLLAAREGHRNIAHLLLNNGAEVDASSGPYSRTTTAQEKNSMGSARTKYSGVLLDIVGHPGKRFPCHTANSTLSQLPLSNICFENRGRN